MIHLNYSNDVDPAFAALVSQTVDNVVLNVRPTEVYVTEIDGWFDYKWQGFSGTVMHEIAVWLHELTVPPFHPSRVVREDHFQLRGSAYELTSAKPLHIAQPSANNLRRALADIASSAVFVWYSNASVASDKSCLMVYTVAEDNRSAWYAGFKRNGTWALAQTKGISRRAIQALLSTAAPNKSLDASGGGVFGELTGPATLE